MFKAEKSANHWWRRVFDEDGKHIANLHELYSGDWSLVKYGSWDWIVDTHFSNPDKAVKWLWNNRFDVGEPYSLYPETEKEAKKSGRAVQLTVVEEPSEDLFWDYKK